jgi:hypothetical protein
MQIMDVMWIAVVAVFFLGSAVLVGGIAGLRAED